MPPQDRAEMRENAERSERVATNAQLVAVEQRWVKLMEEARLEYEARVSVRLRPRPKTLPPKRQGKGIDSRAAFLALAALAACRVNDLSSKRQASTSTHSPV
jgi:hypothetical protein